MIIEQIFRDPKFDNINNTVRWNGRRVIHTESVGHHTHIVTLFSTLIAEDTFPNYDEASMSLKLYIGRRSVFHDFDEMFTGDLLHTFKYNDFNGVLLRKRVDEFCDHKINTLFQGDSPSERLFMNCMKKSNFNVLVNGVVKIADWLSMSYYAEREISLGNLSMQAVLDHCNDGVRTTTRTLIQELMTTEIYVDYKLLRELTQWRIPTDPQPV